MKKVICCLLLAALLLSLAACGQAQPEPSSQTRDTRDIQPTEPAESRPFRPQENQPPRLPGVTADRKPGQEEPQPGQLPQPELPYEDQIAAFAALAPQWVGQGEEYTAPQVHFALSDLNLDGRLELLTAACMGTGMFTYLTVWQLNEDASGVSGHVSDCGADVVVAQCAVFYEPKSDNYRYVMSDLWRAGWQASGSSKLSLLWNGSRLESQLLASYELSVDPESYEETQSWYDAQGNAIDQTAYEQAEHNVYPDLAEGTANLRWLYEEPQDMEEFGQADWEQILHTSWDGFSLDFGS